VLAVLFDYGGVLYPEDGDAFDAFAARYGLPPGRLWAAYHEIPEHRLSRTGRIGNEEYLAGVVRALARDLGAARARAVVEEFQRERGRAGPVDPAMDALLDRLRGRVRLGLLSNAGRGARARLEAAGVAARFDDVLCSAEVGLAKPDPEVFRLAARRLDVEPIACAFVDDMPHNVEGARRVGMRAFHYARRRHEELLRWLEDLGALPREESRS
jgi:putative hydrolase of the HAD superfamily